MEGLKDDLRGDLAGESRKRITINTRHQVL